MVDFLIMYECKNRELEGDILLGTELENRGYSVKYIHSHFYNGKKIKAKVLIMPYAYDNQTLYHHVYRFCGKQQKIISLRSEQIVGERYERDYNSWVYPKEEAKKVYTVSWGKKETDGLIRCGMERKQILETGNINVDLLYDKKLFTGKKALGKRYHINDENQWLLFISSFSMAVISEEEEKGAIARLGIGEREFIKTSKESRKIILEWFAKYLSKYSDREIIYRKHPVEQIDAELQRLVDKYHNFHMISDEGVGEWIFACEKIYNWYSTSAFQSRVLGKENILLRPAYFPKEEDLLIFDRDKKIRSYEEFCEEKKEEDNSGGYSEYFIFKEGAYYRLADECERILHDESGNCQIDYKSVLRENSFKRKVLNLYLYYVLYPYYDIILKHQWEHVQKISHGFGGYAKIYDNIGTKQEFERIKLKVKKYLQDYE